MTTHVIPFQFHTHSVRVVTDENDRPWFVAADVARTLGYRDAHNIARVVPEKYKGTHLIPTPSGEQRMICVAEPGLYRMVVRSDLPAAEPFIDWVTAEVLPAIRQTGGYGMPSLAQHLEAEIHRLRAERDAAREVALASRPAWAKLARYLRMDLSRAEIALLMGWRSTSSVRRQVAKLEQLGLIEQRQTSLDLEVRS